MIEIKKSAEQEFYKVTFIQKLQEVYKKFSQYIYLEKRAKSIIDNLSIFEDILGVGFTQIYDDQNFNESDINKIVICACLDSEAVQQIEKYLHFFQEIFILNLTFSNEETKSSIKLSPIRLKIKGILEISLSFYPFIQNVYQINSSKCRSRTIDFMEGLSNFLISFPKFYEFLICFENGNHNLKKFSLQLKENLELKMKMLQKYNVPNFKQTQSPRYKIVIIDRSIDEMSPLLYSYYHGPILHELLSSKFKHTPISTLLYSLDLQDAGQLIQKISKQKADNQKMKFQLNEYEKAKQTISNHFDENTSTQQLAHHVGYYKSITEFCKRRAFTTSLQQTILNGRSEENQKINGGKVVKLIEAWANEPSQNLKHSVDDYVKIIILAYMVNSFWFFQRKIINAAIPSKYKDRVISFIKQNEGKYQTLQQKKQGQNRYDLYRHQPKLLDQLKKVFDGKTNFNQIEINKTSKNKQTRIVLVVNGPMGYNQIAFLMQQIRQNSEKYGNIIIVCEQLMTTNEYMEYLLASKLK